MEASREGDEENQQSQTQTRSEDGLLAGAKGGCRGDRLAACRCTRRSGSELASQGWTGRWGVRSRVTKLGRPWLDCGVLRG